MNDELKALVNFAKAAKPIKQLTYSMCNSDGVFTYVEAFERIAQENNIVPKHRFVDFRDGKYVCEKYFVIDGAKIYAWYHPDEDGFIERKEEKEQ